MEGLSWKWRRLMCDLRRPRNWEWCWKSLCGGFAIFLLSCADLDSPSHKLKSRPWRRWYSCYIYAPPGSILLHFIFLFPKMKNKRYFTILSQICTLLSSYKTESIFISFLSNHRMKINIFLENNISPDRHIIIFLINEVVTH